eukprot:CAMPEP_0202912234 /NCGR_PEP_ID=MMETSP1392-20130828/57161_1 /ASSEMBLY_ACC=CAM_ASM_000868 /TAXON_ID=225041 /ORGANISM="Chlamydomonas chlamydogama, Strain SAG 11-48b" /LENGTH=173 /DNA_ID=CAMNT_0049603063 /DNA_START=117 /DNA_END=635 /DNA_ORIENTATION=+
MSHPDDGLRLPPLPHLSRLWGDRDASDVKLLIRVRPQGDASPSAAPQPVTCDAHSHVLMGGSEYFLSKIKNWRGCPDKSDAVQARKRKRGTAAQSVSSESMVQRRSSSNAAADAFNAEAEASSTTEDDSAGDSRTILEMVLEPGDNPAAALEAVRYLYFHQLSEEIRGQAALL